MRWRFWRKTPVEPVIDRLLVIELVELAEFGSRERLRQLVEIKRSVVAEIKRSRDEVRS